MVITTVIVFCTFIFLRYRGSGAGPEKAVPRRGVSKGGRNRVGGRWGRSPKGPWWVEKLRKEHKAFHALGAGGPRERQRFIKACLEVGFLQETQRRSQITISA